MNSKATASEIKNNILNLVENKGTITQSKIYPHLENCFPFNNIYEMRRIVKEMMKDELLIHHPIFGGLTIK